MRTLAASLGAAFFAAVLAGPAQAQDYTFRVTHEMAAQERHQHRRSALR